MSKRKGTRGVILLVPCLLLLGLSAGMQETGLPSSGVGPLIEVHGREIAYVPTTAKYVTYDGAVRRIRRFSATLNMGEEDCHCPKCCDGRCYVIIYTDPIMPGGPLRLSYILWLEC
jgi:hypothetical protein